MHCSDIIFLLLLLLSEEILRYMQEIPGGHGWICSLCEYRTNYRPNLSRHIKSKHIKALDFPCTLCDKKFNTAFNRCRHYASHHNLKLSAKEIQQMAENYYQQDGF